MYVHVPHLSEKEISQCSLRVFLLTLKFILLHTLRNIEYTKSTTAALFLILSVYNKLIDTPLAMDLSSGHTDSAESGSTKAEEVLELPAVQYRLYKRRFAGIVGLVSF